MRNLYWDTWKGLAIVAVVMIHACGSALAFPEGSANSMFAVVLRQFINFPVALFVFLSGMFALRGGHTGSYVSSVWSRIVRLMVPYLVWASVYSLAKLLTGKLVVADLPLMIADGTVVFVGYYVVVMLQMAIISPWLERLSASTFKVVVPLSILVSCGFTYGIRVSEYEGTWSSFPYNALPFFLWLPFYLLGLAYAKSHLAPGGLPWAGVLIAVLACAAASVGEALFWMPGSIDLAISQLKVSSIITSVFVCMLMVAMARTYSDLTGWRKALAWLGARSFYFYLAHMLVLTLVQGVLRKLPGLNDVQWLFVPLSASATIVTCAVGALMYEKLVGGRRAALRLVGMA